MTIASTSGISEETNARADARRRAARCCAGERRRRPSWWRSARRSTGCSAATADLDVTLAYLATVRPFDARRAYARRTTGTDVVLVEPYLAGTSAGEVARRARATGRSACCATRASGTRSSAAAHQRCEHLLSWGHPNQGVLRGRQLSSAAISYRATWLRAARSCCGQVLAQQRVGVFVGSTLPGRPRVAEVDLDPVWTVKTRWAANSCAGPRSARHQVRGRYWMRCLSASMTCR